MEKLVTFQVKSENLGAFKREFERLSKKAAKLNVAAPTFEILESKEIPASKRVDGAGAYDIFVPAHTLHTIAVTGQAPRIAGWSFIATLQHESGGNIIRRVPGTEGVTVALDMRTAASDCGHCNVARRRLDTFVVAHDDGRQLQVGRQCLRDFTGHDSPEAIARWAELLSAFEIAVNSGDGEGGFGGGEYCIDVTAYLAHVASVIRDRKEWMSRTKAREFDNEARATANIAWHQAFPPKGDREFKRIEIVQADTDRATSAVAYANAHFEAQESAGEVLNEFEHNLRLTVESRLITFRSAGIAASLIQFVERLQGREMERKKALNSNYVGVVGKREVFELELVLAINIVSEMYGSSTLHIFQDAAGNRLTWKTASERLDVGTKYAVKGTVKQHLEYKGVKQTKLSRCKVEKIDSVVVESAAV